MAATYPIAKLPLLAALYLFSGLPAGLTGCDAAPIGYQAVPRDAFPVFNNPVMMKGPAAEREGTINGRDAVIGVAHGGEAKAYPITIMGVHELGNDTIGGVPIAVTW